MNCYCNISTEQRETNRRFIGAVIREVDFSATDTLVLSHLFRMENVRISLTRMHARVAESLGPSHLATTAIFSGVSKERWENASRQFAVYPRGLRSFLSLSLFLSKGGSEARGIHAREGNVDTWITVADADRKTVEQGQRMSRGGGGMKGEIKEGIIAAFSMAQLTSPSA